MLAWKGRGTVADEPAPAANQFAEDRQNGVHVPVGGEGEVYNAIHQPKTGSERPVLFPVSSND
jgi:hypothetical protein